MCKFYADSMLGKLSRYLRFLGFDTLYRTDESIDEMLQISVDDNRNVLSRSQEVFQDPIQNIPFDIDLFQLI